jgi:hypothetical protein
MTDARDILAKRGHLDLIRELLPFSSSRAEAPAETGKNFLDFLRIASYGHHPRAHKAAPATGAGEVRSEIGR